MIRCCYILLFGALISNCGCGSGLNSSAVKGTVTLNGQPLAGVRVTFFPDLESGTSGPRSSGTTDANGRYELRTEGGTEGAVVGKYQVCLFDIQFLTVKSKEAIKTRDRPGLVKGAQSSAPAAAPVETASAAVSRRIPEIYEHADKTPLRAEVRSGPQTIDFNVPAP